jgi:phage terminase small subunit
VKRDPNISLVRPNVQGSPTRVQPPANLNDKERRLFLELVNGTSPGHFRPTDIPLLTPYCQTSVLAEHAFAMMSKTGGPVLEDGSSNPWHDVQMRALRSLTILATRLRLSPQSRITQKTAGKPGRKSFYDSMTTPQEDDDDDPASA